jgi:hypothetical protein
MVIDEVSYGRPSIVDSRQQKELGIEDIINCVYQIDLKKKKQMELK